MAKIFGTIESLKSLKYELENKGVSRFRSVKEIKAFLSNYNVEELKILKDTSDELEKEYFATCANLKQRIQEKNETINSEKEKIDIRVFDLQTKIDFIHKQQKSNFLKKIYSSIKLYSLTRESKNFVKNKSKLLSSFEEQITKKIRRDELFIKEYETEKQDLIEKRAKSKLETLEHTRNVLESSKNLISGAIGENLVVKEIKKLSDEYILINDFNLSFSQPIFYKKQNQRISSIQIDHLLISKAGIFIIETKNWSKSSVNSLSLRSPVEQIERSNFALYVYISENIVLNGHHWGEQQIPIRNLIIMINNKPKAQFKHVNIKLLREMNDYIRYFEPVLTENQLDRIVNKLI